MRKATTGPRQTLEDTKVPASSSTATRETCILLQSSEVEVSKEMNGFRQRSLAATMVVAQGAGGPGRNLLLVDCVQMWGVPDKRETVLVEGAPSLGVRGWGRGCQLSGVSGRS